MCGKDGEVMATAVTDRGSPPRVRERHMPALISASTSRITPACAGKTLSNFRKPAAIRDHPRVCGKDFFREPGNEESGGSPPRVRERLISYRAPTVNNGITPACAGKTLTALNSPLL